MIHFGAFDVANLGDRLYPILFRRLTGLDTRVAGLQSVARPEFHVEHIDSLTDGDIIVGGGDLFARTSEYQGFMKLPSWPKSCREGFILHREAIYISVGCPFPPLVAPAGFVWARDYRAAANLPAWPDVVAPDLAVLSSDVMDRAHSHERVALVQFAYYSDECVAAIRRLQEDYEVRLVSLTHYNGDSAAMKIAAEKLGLKVHVADTAYELIKEVSRASLVVASSMHANIVAFSFNVPHWFCPTPPMNKIPGFLEVVGLPSYLAAAKWSDIRPERSIVDIELIERAKRRAREALQVALSKTGRNITLPPSNNFPAVVVGASKSAPVF